MDNGMDRFNGQEPPECNTNEYTFYYRAEGEISISANNINEAKEIFNNTPIGEMFEEIIVDEVYKEDELVEKADLHGRLCKVE